MRIVIDKPPNYDAIAAVFPIENREDVIFTYGSVIYNPHGVEISPELYQHEEVHGDRQFDPAKWWEQYLVDPEFRLAEELPAHRAEYAEFCARNSDRNRRAAYRMATATRLAGPLYGSLLSTQAALKLIPR